MADISKYMLRENEESYRCEYGTVADQKDESAYDLRLDRDDDVEKGRIKFPKDKLYGRDDELKTLHGVYDKIMLSVLDGGGGGGYGYGGSGNRGGKRGSGLKNNMSTNNNSNHTTNSNKQQQNNADSTDRSAGSTGTTAQQQQQQQQHGTSQIVFVKGYSGTGKSALMQEFVKQLAARGKPAFFASGKYGEMETGTPFAAISRAVSELMESLLGGHQQQKDGNSTSTAAVVEDQVQQVRSKLKRAELLAGSEDAEVLADMIPDVAPLLRVRRNSSASGCSGSLNASVVLDLKNFIKIFVKFWTCVCGGVREKPVIMFVDDLQWADAASLELIAALCKDRNVKQFIFLGAYRTNEVTEGHAFQKVMDDLGEACGPDRVLHMELFNLSPKDVGQFIADAIGRSEGGDDDDDEDDDDYGGDGGDEEDDRNFETITDAIYAKTLGNVFFVMQALEELVRRNALYFDVVTFRWEWGDVSRVDLDKFLSDDVVTMVQSKIASLPVVLQKTLTVAAHIRDTVDLETLRHLMHSEGLPMESSSLKKLLDHAVAEGILLYSAKTEKDPISGGNSSGGGGGSNRNNNNTATSPTNSLTRSTSRGGGTNTTTSYSYSFAHDRIQEAASKLFYDDRDPFLVRISRVLVLRGCERSANDWMLFVAVHHLNSVDRVHIMDVHALAKLNLQVARLSTKKASFAQALLLLRAGVRCLDKELSWRAYYRLCLDMYNLLGDMEKSLGNYDEAMEAVNTILEHAHTPEDKHPAYYTLVETVCEKSNRNFELTVQKGLEVLSLYGVNISEKPSKVELIKERTRLRLALRSRPLTAITEFPISHDDALEKLMYITTTYASFTSNENLVTMLSLRAICRAVEEGCITKYLGFMVSSQGLPLRQKGKYEEGYGYANCALTLMNRFPKVKEGRFVEARLSLFCSMLLLRRPFDDVMEDFFTLYKTLLSLAVYESGLGAALNICLCFFASSLPLNSLIESNLLLFEDGAREAGMKGFGVLFELFRQFLYNLRGMAHASPTLLKGDAFDEEAVLKGMEGNSKKMTVRDVSTLRLQLACIFDDEPSMEQLLDTLDSYPFQDFLVVRQHLRLAYIGIAALTLAGRASDKATKKKHLKRGTDVLDFFKKLDTFGSPNAHPVCVCLKALHKPKLEAFEEAIAVCNNANLLNLAAMMNERCAELVRRSSSPNNNGGQQEAVEKYLASALWTYNDWGAAGKVIQMREKYAFLRTAQRYSTPGYRLSTLQRKANANRLNPTTEGSDASDAWTDASSGG